MTDRTITANRRLAVLGRACLLVCILGTCGAVPGIAADTVLNAEQRLQAIFNGAAPQGIEDLRAMQQHVQQLAERVLPATVGVQVDAAQGSGVIISREGHVLTAAHVIGKPGRSATVYLPDGRRAAAKTLGAYRTLDAGLLKIDSPENPQPAWPYVPMGDSAPLTLGQWCLAMGHPGGIQDGRQPAARLGRILTISSANSLSTDCTLIGGDSGGPLFDMQGKVVAVHSRIGGPLTANLHVPVSAYQENWKRLARGESWGHTPGNRPFIGVRGEADSKICRIQVVFPKSPAEQAGLRPQDVVVKFGGQPVGDFASLQGYVEEREPGMKVPVEVQRGDQRLMLEVVIGRVRE